MRINVKVLSFSLFWYYPVYLDLDTGLTYNTKFDQNIIDKLPNKRKLPQFSEVAIYQRYMEMAKEQLGIDTEDYLERYPRFELIADTKQEAEDSFFEETHEFFDGIEQEIAHDRGLSNPKYDRSFPSFGEFLDDYTLQFAKDWCDQEGYEWYEE